MDSTNIAYKPINDAPAPPLKTLIVDDEEDMYFLLSNILKQFNIQAIPAGSINEATELLKKEPNIFLIFLDNHLPDGLGYQHVQAFRNLSRAAIVMITAYDTSYDKKLAAEQGVDGFIGKPFTKETILKTVAAIL